MSRHLDNAVLRRHIDEPDALLSYEKEHLLQCARCRGEHERLRENALTAQRLLAADDAVPDLNRARSEIERRAAASARELPVAAIAKGTALSWRWGAVAAAVVVFVAFFTYAPFRAYAQNLLTIFEPRQIEQVSLTSADVKNFHAIPELRDFGTVSEEGNAKARHFSSRNEAARFAHEAILQPTYLPASLPRDAAYTVSPPATVRFTFDARKAKATAARKHVAIPAPPAGIDGATLTASSGAVVITYYGKPHKDRGHEREFPENGVVVMQGPVPTVNADRGNAREIENYLLSLPNVPAKLKAQIRAIADPGSTLPLPVIVDKNTATHVRVGDAQAILVGDNTGVGSAMFWIAHGRFYSVAGGFRADEVRKVAESLEAAR
ncbi:MAG TPA: hypothetical protein VFN49_13280 [Candidatus Aquilonibacter sp.]|nr:hypothetical protein [Candidatus Aquilonibacter sp.]